MTRPAIQFPEADLPAAFAPELVLVATAVAVLAYATFAPRAGGRACTALAAAGALGAALLCLTATATGPVWGGWLVGDATSLYFRAIIHGSTAAVAGLLLVRGPGRGGTVPHGKGVGEADDDGRPFADAGVAEPALLLLGASLGMGLMTATEHVLMMYVALEMAGLPGYVLVTARRTRAAGEAGIKYVVFGAAASGLLLYGASLLYGATGSLQLSDIAAAVRVAADPAVGDAPAGADAGTGPLLTVALVLVFAGLFFKAAAAPFHFWCPDVVEGAAAEVGGFLSVAAKAAAVALILRVSLVLSEVVPGGSADGAAGAILSDGLALVAAVSMTLGNLCALAQTDVQRMLAYSVVAHAGYLLLAVAALSLPLSAEDSRFSGAEAVMAYTAVYAVMNLGAFGVVAFVRQATGRQDLGAFAGIGRRMPAAGVCMTVALMSLAGIPPLAGFLGKFGLLAALFGRAHPEPGTWNIVPAAVLGVAVLNTVLALFYYANVVGLMWGAGPAGPTAADGHGTVTGTGASTSAGTGTEADSDTEVPASSAGLREGFAAKAWCAAMSVPLVAAAVLWGPFVELTARCAAHIHRTAPRPAPSAKPAPFKTSDDKSGRHDPARPAAPGDKGTSPSAASGGTGR